MLVKSIWYADYLQHLSETFDHLWKHKFQLNTEKCIFGVALESSWVIWSFSRGMEANFNQISNILSMKSLTCVKEVQMLKNASQP